MTKLADIEAAVEGEIPVGSPQEIADFYLRVGEDMLTHYLMTKGQEPTKDEKEGFRLLALQRQGCKGDPSFNACRETARELAYHYNLLVLEPEHADTAKRAAMMQMVAKHLVLFVGNKMMDEKTGEFCCSAKANRLNKNKEDRAGGV